MHSSAVLANHAFLLAQVVYLGALAGLSVPITKAFGVDNGLYIVGGLGLYWMSSGKKDSLNASYEKYPNPDGNKQAENNDALPAATERAERAEGEAAKTRCDSLIKL